MSRKASADAIRQLNEQIGPLVDEEARVEAFKAKLGSGDPAVISSRPTRVPVSLPAAEGSAPSLPEIDESDYRWVRTSLPELVMRFGSEWQIGMIDQSDSGLLWLVGSSATWELSEWEVGPKVTARLDSGKDGAQPSAASNLPCALGDGSLAALERGEVTHDPATWWHCQNEKRKRS